MSGMSRWGLRRSLAAVGGASVATDSGRSEAADRWKAHMEIPASLESPWARRDTIAHPRRLSRWRLPDASAIERRCHWRPAPRPRLAAGCPREGHSRPPGAATAGHLTCWGFDPLGAPSSRWGIRGRSPDDSPADPRQRWVSHRGGRPGLPVSPRLSGRWRRRATRAVSTPIPVWTPPSSPVASTSEPAVDRPPQTT